jgi:O-antigen/teichoic acid export membrane protein
MLASLLTRQGFDRTLTLFAVRPRAATHTILLFFTYIRLVLISTPLSGLLNIAVCYVTIGASPSIALALILFILPTLVAISFLTAGYHTGFGRTISASIQQPGFSAALTAAISTAMHYWGASPDVVIVYFVVTALLSCFGFYRILRGSGQPMRQLAKNAAGLKVSIRELASRYSRRYLVINFFTTFSSVYFISFLAFFVSTDVIGQFKIVERLAMVIAFNLSFINIILPASAISHRLVKDQSRFDKSIRLTFLFQYVTGCGIFLTYLAFMNPIMDWMQIDNIAMYILLLSAQLINALTGPVRVILMYLGGQQILQTSAIVETFGSAILYWILYNAFSLTGLAVGYFTAIATPNLILAWIVHRRYGIIPLPFVSPAEIRRS